MDIAKKLNEILIDYKGNSVNASISTTLDEMGFDSLDKVELLMKIEEEFEITFEDDFIVETIGELMEKINLKLIK